MVCLDLTCRYMQCLAEYLRLPWSEQVPDHTTIAKFMQKIPTVWLQYMMTETARQGLAKADSSATTAKKLALVADSTGVATDRRRKKGSKQAQKRPRAYPKWHVASVLGLQIMLCRFRKTSTRRRFGLCKAIGWNIEVLNRLECAAEMGVAVVVVVVVAA